MKSPSETPRDYRAFLLVLLFASLYFSYLIFKPFIHALLLAFLVGSLCAPLAQSLKKPFGGRSNLSALLVVMIISVVIVVPMLFLLSALVTQAFDTITKINEWIKSGQFHKLLSHPKIQFLLTHFQKWTTHLGFSGRISLDAKLTDPLIKATQYVGQFIVSHGSALLGNMLNLGLQFFVFVFVLFYVVRDYPTIIRRIKDISPLREEQEDQILERIRSVAKSALLGSLATSIAQGAAGAVGLAIVGIPALFWGTIMAFASLIPIVGTALVWVPSVIYLLLVGKWKSAIFFLLWSVIVVGSIDNFLRPLFMRGAGQMSSFFVFLSIMGGVQYFGFLGVIYGPLVLACGLVMLYIYEAEYGDAKPKNDRRN
ncbi:MAG: AI-2E family transporter [Deltaproteobacteria bacterium]|nr:AI-2E family transporter [Deltaproteobacteria bacterium]